MIRPLRRQHRWIIPALFLILLVIAVLTATRPLASARVDRLPAALIAGPRSEGPR
jgi:hypothetical protein